MSWEATKAVLARSRLKRGPELLLLMTLAERADRDGWAWPSLARLERDTGLPRRTLLRHLAKAEKVGDLRRERRQDDRRGTRYQLTPAGEPIGASRGTHQREKTVPNVAPVAAAEGASRGTHPPGPIGASRNAIGANPRAQRAAEPSREPPSVGGTELTGVPRSQPGPSHIEDGAVRGGRPAAETALLSATIACQDPRAHRSRYHILHLDGRLRCSDCERSGAGEPTQETEDGLLEQVAAWRFGWEPEPEV